MHRINERAIDSTTLLSIQYLRAIAALMVVWHHALGQVKGLDSFLPTSSFGTNGVDLFFVISGFIMVLTTFGKAVSPWNFVRKRISRVVPLYWLITFTVAVLATLAPNLFKTTNVSASHVIQSLLFIPHYSPSFPEHIYPILVPGWTLNFEMFFYALFGLCLMFRRERVVIGVLIALCLLVGVGKLTGPFQQAALVVYTSPLMLEFGLGVAIGWLYCSGRLSTSRTAAVVLGGVGVYLLSREGTTPFRADQMMGSAALVVASLSEGLRQWQNAILKVLGDASYSIYLTHIPALGVARVTYAKLVGDETSLLLAWGFVASALAFCCLVGWLSFLFVERPLFRLIGRIPQKG